MSQRRLGGETLKPWGRNSGGGICGTDFFREGVIVFGPGVFIGAVSCRLVPRKESHPFFFLSFSIVSMPRGYRSHFFEYICLIKISESFSSRLKFLTQETSYRL